MVQPVQKFKDSGIDVTIWENKTKDGETYYSVNIAKQYKDNEGNYKTSKAYFEKDLQMILELTTKALVWIKEKKMVKL